MTSIIVDMVYISRVFNQLQKKDVLNPVVFSSELCLLSTDSENYFLFERFFQIGTIVVSTKWVQ